MEQTNKQQKIRQPRWSYAGFLYHTFIKRPFGYIIPCLYVVYLSVILIIVPKIMHTNPLFIWNVGGFNMPVFNLFFIAASAAALAVCIFRTGREDGTELSLSAKPLTKGAMVGMKVFVYLTIMLAFCLIANLITLILLPVFGVYNESINVRGISYEQYLGINLSVLLGNIVNMLLFGGIAVLITMVGGQVITMIGTVGIVFVMCLMNFIYPQVVTSSLEVLRNKYDAEIASYTCPTYNQYESKDSSGHKTYATIECVTNQYDEEIAHFDTAEYWKKAEKESGGKATNYVDFARQLSSLFNSFGLDESKLKEASKLSIGTNRGYDYKILENTHVELPENVEQKQYPIAFYGMTTRQGMQYPQVYIVGGDMGVSTDNWFAISKLSSYDFDSVSILTTGLKISLADRHIYNEYQRPFQKITDVYLTDVQKQQAEVLYKAVLQHMKDETDPSVFKREHYFSDVARNIIINDDSGVFFTAGEYPKLTARQQYQTVSKIHFYWSILAHERQKQSIGATKFPFSSKQVKNWYKVHAETPTDDYYHEFKLGEFIFSDSIQVRQVEEGKPDGVEGWNKLVTGKISYAETYANLYQYGVTNFYSINTIITVWSVISLVFFTTAIVVYKKTDFK